MNDHNDDEADEADEADIAAYAATLEALKFCWKKGPRDAREYARWVKIAVPPGCEDIATGILNRTADMLQVEIEGKGTD